MKKKINRQIVIDQLVTAKKNLMGDAAKNIISLYKQLHLVNDSFSKLNSRKWYKIALGIQELYIMEQREALQLIEKYAGHKNELVRTEVQIALVNLLGFNGLHFLDGLSSPISSWQQARLLEELRPMDMCDMPRLNLWLHSHNKDVIMFALKLVEVYYEAEAYEAVLTCLRHPDEGVRRQAVNSIARMAKVSIIAVLIAQYKCESPRNKKNILFHLEGIATDSELTFLLTELKEEKNTARLDVARVIAMAYPNGLQLLAEKANETPLLYGNIYLHIKRELTL
ncbi:HEAT repeat domain-containing protein [Chitinophaga sp. CF118]|uniref:HEAT repeat domain-containing protein n=1 Tax=Chitinophaga sp. CF118 TaxID=1884367 RepID=UPI001160A2E7|nr:hypothetical protein [Chitinophaga sp. CF118]